MGVITVDQEFTSPIAPKRLFKALYLENHHLIPKLVPHRVKNIDIIEGDGGVGTIKQINFAEGGKFNYMKNKVDAIDVEGCSIKSSVIEGDILGDKLERAVFDVKFEPAGAESVCKVTGHFHTKGEVEPTKEQIDGVKDRFAGFHKVVEDYLVANPSVYA